MLPARRLGLFSPTFLKSIKASSLLYMLQDWVRREIVADDPWDENGSYSELPSALPPSTEFSKELLPIQSERIEPERMEPERWKAPDGRS